MFDQQLTRENKSNCLAVEAGAASWLYGLCLATSLMNEVNIYISSEYCDRHQNKPFRIFCY